MTQFIFVNKKSFNICTVSKVKIYIEVWEEKMGRLKIMKKESTSRKET